MENIIVLLIIVAIVGSSIAYFLREKRRGVKCVGCSLSKSCDKKKKSI